MSLFESAQLCETKMLPNIIARITSTAFLAAAFAFASLLGSQPFAGFAALPADPISWLFTLFIVVAGIYGCEFLRGYFTPESSFGTSVSKLISASILLAPGAVYLLGTSSYRIQTTSLPVAPQIAVALTVILAAIGLIGLPAGKAGQQGNGPHPISAIGLALPRELAAHLLNALLFSLLVKLISGYEGVLELVLVSASILSLAAFPAFRSGWGARELAAVLLFIPLGIEPAAALIASLVFGGTQSTILFLLRRRTDTAPVSSAGQKPLIESLASSRNLLFLACLALFLAVFFQMQIYFGNKGIMISLADPIILVIALVTAGFWFTHHRIEIPLPKKARLWILAVTLLLAGSFLYGYSQFGLSLWAFGNRLIGWCALILYIWAGALIARGLGERGLIYICGIVLLSAATITLCNIVFEVAFHKFGIDLGIPRDLRGFANFQGFSSNRNAFSFQLIIAYCCGLIMITKSRNQGGLNLVWTILTSLVLFGIWQTQSKTGLIGAGAVLVLIALFSPKRYLIIFQTVALSVCFYAILLAIFHFDWGSLFSGWKTAGGSNELGAVRQFSGVMPSSMIERWETMLDGLRLWQQSPIFGAGLGAFVNEGYISYEGHPLIIHSTPVWVLAEMGLLGLLILLVLPAIWLLRRADFSKSLHLNTYRSLLLMLAMTFFLFSLPHDIFAQRIFWLLTGACLAGQHWKD